MWLVKKWITKTAFVNWGDGNRWQVDSIELKKKSQKTSFGENRIESIWSGGVYPTCMACSHGANIPEAFHIAVWALSTTPNETINREPHRVATVATAAPTDTDHSTAYPGGGSSKKILAVAITIFPPARSAKRDENTRTKGSTQNTEEKLKTSIAASPSLSRALRSRASSAYSREAESDRFLACAAKRNRGCRRRARDDSRRRSHLLSSVLVSRVLCEMLLFFRTHKISRTRGFPIEPKAVFSHQIESNSSRLIRKRRFESIRFEELSPLIRALSFCFFSISAEFFFFFKCMRRNIFFQLTTFLLPTNAHSGRQLQTSYTPARVPSNSYVQYYLIAI